MKRPLANKKGVAIELAISMLVVVFALCSILLVLTKQLVNGINSTTKIHNLYAELDTIGEGYLSGSVDTDKAWYNGSGEKIENPTDDEKKNYYYCEIESKKLTVKRNPDGSALLEVTRDSEGKLKSWKYPAR